MKTKMNRVDQFVVKVAGRCNIACKYCYMYELGDNSALSGPKIMPIEVENAMVSRISKHARLNNLDSVSVAFHGGEPLMFGHARFLGLAQKLRTQLGDRLRLSVQTNGILLNDAWLEAFAETDTLVGLSMDGPLEAHDEWRVDHRGRGTYSRTLKAYNFLRENASSLGVRFGGVISVINPRKDASKYYHWLKELQVNQVNILLPDANHNNYTTHYPYEISDFSNFLENLFTKWWLDDKRRRPNILFFSNILNLIVGGKSESESIGLGEAPAIIIEADGSIQPHDVLRMNHDIAESANVLTHEIHSILDNKIYQLLNPSLYGKNSHPCEKCSNCPVQKICGGGFVAHRYSKLNGYSNPSVYCDALFNTISYIYFNAASEQKPKSASMSL